MQTKGTRRGSIVDERKIELKGQPLDETLLMSEYGYRHYKTKRANCTGKTTENLVISNPMNSWYQSIYLLKCNRACTNNLADIPVSREK